MVSLNNRCTSTKKQITNDAGAVTFKCPNCAKSTIIRSSTARALVAKYHCAECGFEGPN